MRPYVENYQPKGVALGMPHDIYTTTYTVYLVEILLVHLSDIDANKVSMR